MPRETVLAVTAESISYDELPLPGSVSGPRAVRLLLDDGDFRPDVVMEELHRTLGFSKSTAGWRYDRNQALNWFLSQLETARDDWSVALYEAPPAVQQAPQPSTPVASQPAPTPAPPRTGGGGVGRTQGVPTKTR